MAAEALILIQAIDGGWAQAKDLVEQATGSHNDLVHIVAGPIVQLIAALVLRRSVQSIWPWLTVLALELLNEWHDLTVEVWPTRAMQYGEGLKDILLTMMLPTIILLVARYFPHWLGLKPYRPNHRSRERRG